VFKTLILFHHNVNPKPTTIVAVCLHRHIRKVISIKVSALHAMNRVQCWARWDVTKLLYNSVLHIILNLLLRCRCRLRVLTAKPLTNQASAARFCVHQMQIVGGLSDLRSQKPNADCVGSHDHRVLMWLRPQGSSCYLSCLRVGVDEKIKGEVVGGLNDDIFYHQGVAPKASTIVAGRCRVFAHCMLWSSLWRSWRAKWRHT
jgi:hypothetical protein